MAENNKLRLLFIGITMNCAGTEKAFLSLAAGLDYEKYDVTLLLAKKDGPLSGLIPPQIKVIELPEYGGLFTLNGSNAASVIMNECVKRNPLLLFAIAPYFIKMKLMPKSRSFTAMRLWYRLMRRMPELPGEYDIALAYWGDKTMFYTVDKVKARRKVAWLHFDYCHPPRDDSLYMPFFEKCNCVVNVSQSVTDALISKLPSLAPKCVTMENIIDSRLIWEMSLRGDTFPDHNYAGLRILTVARICEQKGVDYIPPVLAKLRDQHYDVRWYIIGGGDEADVNALKIAAVDAGVADSLILLGTTVNPYGYMRDCDIFALPSRYEGKPITVEEAKILYKPIVVGDYVSATEQLDSGKLGVISSGGVDGIYDSIKMLLDSRMLREEFSETLSRLKTDSAPNMQIFENEIINGK